jgi:hypothetical protein
LRCWFYRFYFPINDLYRFDVMFGNPAFFTADNDVARRRWPSAAPR